MILDYDRCEPKVRTHERDQRGLPHRFLVFYSEKTLDSGQLEYD